MSRTDVRRLRRVAERDRVCAEGLFWSPRSGGVLVDVFGVASTGTSSPIAPPKPEPAPATAPSVDRRALGLTCPLRRRSEVRAADWVGVGGGAGFSSASTARTRLSSAARVLSSAATTCCARRYKQRERQSLFCCWIQRHPLANTNNFPIRQGKRSSQLDYRRNTESL